MQKFMLLGALGAILCGSLSAQVINVSRPGWGVFPGSALVYNPFVVSGATINDYIQGGCVASVGTSETSSVFYASASFDGQITGGPSISATPPSSTAVRTETYNRATGTGPVSTTLTVRGAPSTFINRSGSGYRGVANASVSTNCPAFAAIQASCQVRGVQPPANPIIMTLPVTGTVTNLPGQNFWWVVMYASSNTSGTMSGSNGILKMFAMCDGSGSVTLN